MNDLSGRLRRLFKDLRRDEEDFGNLIEEVRRLENEVSDLQGFIDGMKPHVLAAAKMYGATAKASANIK